MRGAASFICSMLFVFSVILLLLGCLVLLINSFTLQLRIQCMFNTARKTAIQQKEAISFERVRAILFLSKFTKKKLWICLIKEDDYYIVDGTVTGIINNPLKNNKRQVVGGEFYLNDSLSEGFNMESVYAIGSSEFKLTDLNREDVLVIWKDIEPQVEYNSSQGDLLLGNFEKFNDKYYQFILECFNK